MSENLRRFTRKQRASCTLEEIDVHLSNKKKKSGDRKATIVKFVGDNDVGKLLTLRVPGSSTIKKKLTKPSRKMETSTKKSTKNEESEVEDNSDSDNSETEICEKPSGLCDEDEVAGNEMCSFRTPKKRHGMINKAKESASKHKSDSVTPKRHSLSASKSECVFVNSRTPSHKLTPRQTCSTKSKTTARNTPQRSTATPRRIKTIQEEPVKIPNKTPYQLRVRHKQAMQEHRRALEAFDNDSEDSDYKGSSSEKSSSDSETSGEEDSSSDSGKGSEQPACRRSLQFQQSSVNSSSRKKGKDCSYVFTADEYFESQSSKCVTSDRNLSRLATPRLAPDALHTLLSNCDAPSDQHTVRVHHPSLFQRWMFALSQGFSVLTYGLGSKQKLLQAFHREMLPDSRVLVVNGFFPGINIKEIVDTLARELLGLKQLLPSPHAIVDWIEGLRRMPRVFLIVHNLDGEMLRCEKTQRVLSRLASLSRVHMVASVDHINCPLLWDQAKLSEYNFMWEDATSFLSYEQETSYETSLMVRQAGSLALSSLLNVFRSLTHNSRGVFRIILDKHLEENSPKYQGIAFSDLYSQCREEMLVTSDLALRTMLTEFLDHEMVKYRRDGEHLYIPTDSAILRQFHKQVQDK